MNATANRSSHDILKNFIPLNTLPSTRFNDICNDCLIEECAKGTVLFEQGDESKEFIYLISGMVSLYAGEMEMETSVVEIDEEPNEEEKNELKALQSELNLVREQTEKDIQAMQVKLENSEKMNMALKKKILSMQTIANQEVIPEEPSTEKKKGWWK